MTDNLSSEQIKELDAQYVMQTYGRFDLAIDHGKGATLYTPEGRELIDLTSGIGVNSLGYGNERWVAAIAEQAARLGHISNLFYSEPYAVLAQQLVDRSGLKRAFFANGGGESNEGMIKCARKYSHDKYGEGRSTIVTLRQSFHGRTVTTLAATGQDVFHQHFFPFTEGFRYAVANDVASLEEALAPGDVCAVMVELVQGEGGVLPLDQAYVDALVQICRERDILLAMDEVQTGIGRTGSLFCFEQYGVLPDLVTFAKGIAGGLPMGGLLAGEKCADTLGPGMHATTFGGNPIAAAAARVVLETLDDELLAEVQVKGEHLRQTVHGWESAHVRDVRGMGLMVGIEVDVPPVEVARRAIDEGVLVLTAGSDAVRLLPPLTITEAELDRGLAALHRALG